MRQPTFSRKRRMSRQKRLLRTGIVLVVAIAVIAALVSLFSGGTPKQEKLAHVSFAGTMRAESDTSKRPTASAIRAERRAITSMLNGWYQQAYVDPSKYGDGTFPAVATLFASGARRSFARDVTSMTIGDLIKTADHVQPTAQVADVTVFFTNGKAATLAVAAVTFKARVTLKDSSQLPVLLEQHGVYHLQKIGGSWMVAYYDVKQDENTIQPSPSGSPS